MHAVCGKNVAPRIACNGDDYASGCALVFTSNASVQTSCNLHNVIQSTNSERGQLKSTAIRFGAGQGKEVLIGHE
jgi:hypothetical protein